jgi:hypothetical protein
MAWTKLKLEQKWPPDKWAVLVYGANAVGKTHFLGDFIRTLAAEGKKTWFINTAYEDGWGTLGDLEGTPGFTAADCRTVDDFEEAVVAAKKDGAYGIAVDSLIGASKMLWYSYFGIVRAPDAAIDGTRSQAMWSKHRQDLENMVHLTRDACTFAVWAATYDKAQNEAGTSRLAPDLYGKESNQSAGWFDFVAQLKAQATGPASVKRTLVVKPDETVLTRQRFRRAITQDITIPADKGGWAALMKAAAEAAGVKVA